MGFEENNPSDISISIVHTALKEFFPVNFFYHGTYNVFQIENRFIARFPDKSLRNAKGAQLIKNEIDILNLLSTYLSFNIPKPLHFSLNIENPFMVYEKIPGISLSKCFNEIKNSKKEKIAHQIADFLSELHSLRLDESSKIESLSTEDYHDYWLNISIEMKKEIFPKLNSEQKKWLDNVFSNFLEDNRNFKFTPCVIHGDFDTSNILVDPNSFNITGIIDFEESSIFDPAADFLFYDEGEIFLKNILDNYKGIKEESFLNRMKFLYCRTCVPYFLFGLKNNRMDVYSEGMTKLKKNMKTFLI
ncbi:MAG: phosphotransferase family protein [Promethearchaeota archaeon]